MHLPSTAHLLFIINLYIFIYIKIFATFRLIFYSLYIRTYIVRLFSISLHFGAITFSIEFSRPCILLSLDIGHSMFILLLLLLYINGEYISPLYYGFLLLLILSYLIINPVN